MKVKDIIYEIERFAPLAYQESYDNAGLLVGDREMEVNAVLVTLDCTPEVLEEALEKGANMILTHHPVIFSGVKRITGANMVEQILITAIKNDIAIYASHTNLDSVIGGVNSRICEKIGLEKIEILDPIKASLSKLVTFVPSEHAEDVQQAVFNAGAGHIGNYDCCGYNLEGYGSFRANDKANPFVGNIGEIHKEKEIRFETVFPKYLKGRVINALLAAHPYEEVAYDIYSLENEFKQVGIGMVGELKEPVDELVFLNRLKKIFNAQVVRHTKLLDKPVRKIAVCGGSGSFLLTRAMAAKADVFVTGDFKYHQFFEAENKILVADLGHYETEQFTKDIFYDLIQKKFPNFAVHLSEINSNPINYL